MTGFFDSSTLIAAKPRIPLLPRCGQCQLFKKCRSPKMPIYGHGARKILVIGEGPGYNEDLQNRPFVGDSGQVLREELAGAGIDLRRDCWTTNSIICRSTDSKDKNRTPTDREITHCRPNIVKAVRELRPEVIILLGGPAVKSLVGWLWKEDVGPIFRWVGWKIPVREINTWVCPTWHPAYLLWIKDERTREITRSFFRKHLKAAAKLKGRPWNPVPELESRVRIVYDPAAAATAVRGMIGDRPIAFDFECEGLKPDNRELAIVSCALSDGVTAVAFPWHGEAIQATKEFLQSVTPKIGFSAKYEDRWSRREFGFGVNGWVWDGMLAAHVLDNRSLITSLAFQEFAVLGISNHKEGMTPYLKSAGSNEKNRIREADLHTLLTYNAMDALVEMELAMVQSKKMGIELRGKNGWI